MSLYNDDEQDDSYDNWADGPSRDLSEPDPTNDASHGPSVSAEQAAVTGPQPAQVLPPEKPGFPFGWAILGTCAFAVLLAASMDKEK